MENLILKDSNCKEELDGDAVKEETISDSDAMELHYPKVSLTEMDNIKSEGIETDRSKCDLLNFVEVLEPKMEVDSDLDEKDPLNICDEDIASAHGENKNQFSWSKNIHGKHAAPDHEGTLPNNAFKTEINIENVASVCEDKRPIKCTICNYNCSQKDILNNHIASVHEGKKPFICSTCNYSCLRKGRLTKHIESVHEGKKPFKCSICDYNCSQKVTLIQHLSLIHI